MEVPRRAVSAPRVDVADALGVFPFTFFKPIESSTDENESVRFGVACRLPRMVGS